MTTNIFEDIKSKKNQVKNFAQVALNNNWMTNDDYQKLIQKIDKDILTIGVIGQMKCGKSTFLNSFIFGDDILPSATTPMTAALSVITYGAEKSIEVEFYDSNEWAEMKMQADRNIEEANGDKSTESKIKAAKELVEKSHKIGTELQNLLGTTKKDRFENLIEYVGADGKYVALTKSVTVYYPEEWLKGVKVVDTPGFNDPVVSREERTQEFLKQADVVVMLTYSGRAFDATDSAIVFEKVRSVGIGKILIGINKYDIQYEQGETIEEISNNVKEEIKKACKEYGDETINDLLLNLEPIPFSSSMALMAKLPLERIMQDENYKFHWNKACDSFEINNQKSMLEKSLVKNLENAIKNVIEHSKNEILLKKPVNSILASGKNKLSKIEGEISENVNLKESISLNDEELEERIKKLNQANRRVERIFDNASDDIEEELEKVFKNITRNIEDEVNEAGKKMHTIIDEYSRFKGKDKLERELNYIWDNLITKEIKRKLEDTEKSIKLKIKNKGSDIYSDIEDIIRKYIPHNEELAHQFKSALRKVEYIDDEPYGDDEETNNTDIFNWEDIAWDVLKGFVKGALIIPAVLELANWKDEYRKIVDNQIDSVKGCLPELTHELRKMIDFYISFLNAAGDEKILPSLIEQLREVQGKAKEREAKIQECKQNISRLQDEKIMVSKQIEEMKSLAKQI